MALGPLTRLYLPLIVAAFFSAPLAAEMVGHGGVVRAVTVSPDGTTVATAGFDYTARIWNFADQSEATELDGHAGPVNTVAFLPDSRAVLTGGDDRVVILWDLRTGAPLRRLEGHGHKVMSIAVSPDGRHAASGGWDKTVIVWNLKTGQQVQTIRHPTPVNAVAWNGSRIVTAAHDGVIRLWDAATGNALGRMVGNEMGVADIAVSADGRRLLTAGIDETLRLWDLDSFHEIKALKGHEGQVLAAAFAPDQTTAVSAGVDGVLVHWDLPSGIPKRSLKAHDGMVWDLAFSPDGRFVLSAGADEAVRVWHIATGDAIGPVVPVPEEPRPWLTSDHPGARLYRKCASCHTLTADGPRRSGPHFAGLFGRRAGAVPGFNYSTALRDSDLVWTDETLAALFREGPDTFVPGSKMPLQQISDEAQLAALIDYMQRITAPATDR